MSRRPPSSSLQFIARSSLTIGSLFAGAATVHMALAPDLTLPDLEPPKPVHVEGFVPAETFGGARAGMVFKRDAAGLGYYPDTSAR